MSEGRKFDDGKPMMSLLPPWAEEEIAKVLTFGAQKYDVDNWKIVPDGKRRYLDALCRHINAYRKGQIYDQESGLHHLAHAGCCLMFILDADTSGNELAPPVTKEKVLEIVQKKTSVNVAPLYGDIDDFTVFEARYSDDGFGLEPI